MSPENQRDALPGPKTSPESPWLAAFHLLRHGLHPRREPAAPAEPQAPAPPRPEPPPLAAGEPPTPGVTPPPPPAPGAMPPPPPAAPLADARAQALRAGFELDSAYRELRRAELMIQQMENHAASASQLEDAHQLFAMASAFHRKAYQAYEAGRPGPAAEYAVAVKDILRAMDKLYNIVMMS